MGYRSDVHILFYIGHRVARDEHGEVHQVPIGPLAPIKLWFDENYPTHKYAKTEIGVNYIYVTYHNVKWYEGCDEVEAVNKAITSFDECFNTDDYENMTGMWEMVRLGEEDDDVERRNSAHSDWRLNLRREVIID